MTNNTTDEKGCGPQPFSESQPTKDWTLEQLSNYAKAKYGEIVTHEAGTAARYWSLGYCLSLARQQFTRGQWLPFLRSLGIDETRASKARTIYRTFDNAAAVAEMSVDEAYAARKKTTTPAGTNTTDTSFAVEQAKLMKSLCDVEQRAVTSEQYWPRTSSAEKRDLLKLLRHTIEILQQKVQMLEASFTADQM